HRRAEETRDRGGHEDAPSGFYAQGQERHFHDGGGVVPRAAGHVTPRTRCGMNDGWFEFGAVALAHGLAVASPGPDFILVLRQSLRYGRATATASAVGIGCGILVHVTWSLLGVALLVRHQPLVF